MFNIIISIMIKNRNRTSPGDDEDDDDDDDDKHVWPTWAVSALLRGVRRIHRRIYASHGKPRSMNTDRTLRCVKLSVVPA